MKKNFWFLLLIFSCLAGQLSAQIVTHQPYQRYGGSLEYQIQLPSNYPPLQTGMPYDIMLGYVYFDSLTRAFTYDSLMSIIPLLNYSDTLKYAMKYLYKLDDYDLDLP